MSSELVYTAACDKMMTTAIVFEEISQLQETLQSKISTKSVRVHFVGVPKESFGYLALVGYISCVYVGGLKAILWLFNRVHFVCVGWIVRLKVKNIYTRICLM